MLKTVTSSHRRCLRHSLVIIATIRTVYTEAFVYINRFSYSWCAMCGYFWCLYMLAQDSLFTDRVFKMFDTDQNGTITLEEFMDAVAVLSKNGPVMRRSASLPHVGLEQRRMHREVRALWAYEIQSRVIACESKPTYIMCQWWQGYL